MLETQFRSSFNRKSFKICYGMAGPQISYWSVIGLVGWSVGTWSVVEGQLFGGFKETQLTSHPLKRPTQSVNKQY